MRARLHHSLGTGLHPGPGYSLGCTPLPGDLQLTDMVGRRDRNLGSLNRDTNRRLHTHVHGITIHSSQTVGAAQVSVNRRTDKQNVVSIYNRIYLAIERSEGTVNPELKIKVYLNIYGGYLGGSDG